MSYINQGTSTQYLDCGNSMKGDKNPAWRGYGLIPNKIFGRIKRDANLRGVLFDVTIKYIN